MQKRQLNEVLPQNLFMDGGDSQRFMQQKCDPQVTINLDSLAIDDRSSNAAGLFGDYLWQVFYSQYFEASSENATNRPEIYKDAIKWLSSRFEHDKTHHLQPSDELTKFYASVMNALTYIVEDVGAERFVDLLVAGGLLDMACTDKHDYYIDWLTLLVMQNKHTAACHLIMAGFTPNEPGFFRFIDFQYPLMNTTALCYKLKAPFIAALLERCGFPATETRYLELHANDIHWLADMSKYPGAEHKHFRSKYVQTACTAWLGSPDKKSLSCLESLFKSLTFDDILEAVTTRTSHAARKAMISVLADSIDAVRDGVFDINIHALPQWLTLSPEQPLILTKESNAHRKLVLNYTEVKYQQFIKALADSQLSEPYLDAYIINADSGNLMSLEDLNQSFESEQLNPLSESYLGLCINSEELFLTAIQLDEDDTPPAGK